MICSNSLVHVFFFITGDEKPFCSRHLITIGWQTKQDGFLLQSNFLDFSWAVKLLQSCRDETHQITHSAHLCCGESRRWPARWSVFVDARVVTLWRAANKIWPCESCWVQTRCWEPAGRGRSSAWPGPRHSCLGSEGPASFLWGPASPDSSRPTQEARKGNLMCVSFTPASCRKPAEEIHDTHLPLLVADFDQEHLQRHRVLLVLAVLREFSCKQTRQKISC